MFRNITLSYIWLLQQKTLETKILFKIQYFWCPQSVPNIVKLLLVISNLFLKRPMQELGSIRESNWQKSDELLRKFLFYLVSMLFLVCLTGIINIIGWDELIKSFMLLILIKKFIYVPKIKTLIFLLLCLKD